MSPKESLVDRLAKRSAVIGIIGLGYVGLPLMMRFVEQGFRVNVFLMFSPDPGNERYSMRTIPKVVAPDQYPSLSMRSIACDASTLATQDCVVIATNHDSFDYELIRSKAALIVDTRGRYDPVADRIVR